MILPRTTIHLSIPRPALITARVRAWLYRHDPIALVSVVIVALIIAGGALRSALSVRSEGAPIAAQATAKPIILIATAQPPERIAAALPTATPAHITAYVSPNGVAFPDPIAQPAPADWIARWGNEWIEVRYSPNPVWIRAADVGAVLTDVATASDPQIHPIAPPPAAAEPSYQVTNEAPAAEAEGAHLYGLTEEDMQQALDEHNARELAACDAGRSANADYCAMVREAVEAH